MEEYWVRCFSWKTSVFLWDKVEVSVGFPQVARDVLRCRFGISEWDHWIVFIFFLRAAFGANTVWCLAEKTRCFSTGAFQYIYIYIYAWLITKNRPEDEDVSRWWFLSRIFDIFSLGRWSNLDDDCAHFFGHGLVKNHQLDLEFSDRDFLSLTIHPMWALRELDGGSVIFKVGFNTTELEVDLKASFYQQAIFIKGFLKNSWRPGNNCLEKCVCCFFFAVWSHLYSWIGT